MIFLESECKPGLKFVNKLGKNKLSKTKLRDNQRRGGLCPNPKAPAAQAMVWRFAHAQEMTEAWLAWWTRREGTVVEVTVGQGAVRAQQWLPLLTLSR